MPPNNIPRAWARSNPGSASACLPVCTVGRRPRFVHTNYFLLDFAFFGLANLALGRQGLVLRLILQFAPSLLPLFRELPLLYAMAGDPLEADARHIIASIRAPHYELPLTSLQDFLPFVGWHLLAMSCIGMETANRGVSSRLVRHHGRVRKLRRI